jgi:glycosyltransferase involved in cell wall biosynthesis
LISTDPVEQVYVSVIIPTYNSARSLPLCLGSIEKQNYPYREVLVVDNYSRDETRRIAEGFGARVILHRGTQAAARNVGIAHSKGRYILFLDSDQQLNGGVIENCVWMCSMCGVQAVKIPEVFVGLNFWGKCSGLWKNKVVKACGSHGGIPRFYERRALLQLSAFNDKLRWWDDLELYQRLRSAGLREAWCSGRVVHYEDYSLQDIMRKYVSYGRSIAEFKSKMFKAAYATTFRLTLSTMAQTLRDPGRSVTVFMGCLFLVVVKIFCATLGLLSRLK